MTPCTHNPARERRQGIWLGFGLAIALAVVLWVCLLCSGCIICAPATSHTFEAAEPESVATNAWVGYYAPGAGYATNLDVAHGGPGGGQ